MKSLWLIYGLILKMLGKVSVPVLKRLPFVASVGITRVKPPIFKRDGGKIESYPPKIHILPKKALKTQCLPELGLNGSVRDKGKSIKSCVGDAAAIWPAQSTRYPCDKISFSSKVSLQGIVSGTYASGCQALKTLPGI